MADRESLGWMKAIDETRRAGRLRKQRDFWMQQAVIGWCIIGFNAIRWWLGY